MDQEALIAHGDAPQHEVYYSRLELALVLVQLKQRQFLNYSKLLISLTLFSLSVYSYTNLD